MTAPAVPFLVGPNDDVAVTALPNLVARCSTVDAAVYAVIVTAGGRIVSIRPMVYQGGGGTTFTYQMAGPSGTNNFKSRHRCASAPVSGSWQVTLFGSGTTWIPYNATATEIRDAVEALPDLNPGDAAVTGTLTDTVNGVLIEIQNHRARVDYTAPGALHGFEDAGQNLRNASGNLEPIITTKVQAGTGDIPNLGTANPNGYNRWGWYAVARRDGEYSGAFQYLKQAGTSQIGYFWYAQPPIANITRPIESESFDGTAPLFVWSFTNETTHVPVTYQEINYVDNGDDTSVFLWATSSARPSANGPMAHTITPRDTGGSPEARQFRIPRSILVNSPPVSDRYRAGFRFQNAAGQETFVLRNFDIQFTPPAMITGFAGTVASNRSYIDFVWNKSFDPQFTGYRITIQPNGEDEVTVFYTTDVDELSYRSLEFPFNTDFTARIYAEAFQVSEQISDPAELSFRVNFSGTVVSEMVFPRQVLVLPARRDRETISESEDTFRTAWGSQFPTRFHGKAFHNVVSATFVLTPPGFSTAQDQRQAINLFYDMIRSGEKLFLRDATGRVMACFATHPEIFDPVEFPFTELSVDFIQTERPEVG